MADEAWVTVDRLFASLFLPQDDVLDAVLASSAAAGLPAIHVPGLQGKFLMLLTEIQQANRVLEIGTLAGYSTIWLARGVGRAGRVVTLESDPARATLAQANVRLAGLEEIVDVRVGPAAKTLEALAAAGHQPFDLVFLDADRPHYPDYLEPILRLSRPGTIIVADNVVRAGAVADPASPDAGVQGVRRFLEAVAADPRVSTTAMQTVGGKGHDGFALIRVRSGVGERGGVGRVT